MAAIILTWPFQLNGGTFLRLNLESDLNRLNLAGLDLIIPSAQCPHCW